MKLWVIFRCIINIGERRGKRKTGHISGHPLVGKENVMPKTFLLNEKGANLAPFYHIKLKIVSIHPRLNGRHFNQLKNTIYTPNISRCIFNLHLYVSLKMLLLLCRLIC
jgi:hypothetical protein